MENFAWTKTQRDKWIESKKKQIITILTRNSINPQTKKPHPPQRFRKSIGRSAYIYRILIAVPKNKLMRL